LDSDDHKGDKIMSQKKTKGALFVEKLKGDEKLQAEMKNDPGEVLKKFGFDVEDLPSEVAAAFTGAGVGYINEVISMNDAGSGNRPNINNMVNVEPGGSQGGSGKEGPGPSPWVVE
jgi:hypothetical protein